MSIFLFLETKEQIVDYKTSKILLRAVALFILQIATVGAGGGNHNDSRNSIDNELNENGFSDFRIGMPLIKIREIMGNNFREDKSEDPSATCLLVHKNGERGISFIFFRDRLVRIDVSKGSSDNISAFGVHLGSDASTLSRLKRFRSYNFQHYSGDGEYITVFNTVKLNGVKFFVENGKVSWISAGTKLGLNMDEGCV
jgi:hypothetical protein